MTRFIKLTSTIINTAHIKKIMIEADKYFVHLSDQNINGSKFGWSGYYILSSDSKIEICKEKNIADYTIMNTWINNLNPSVTRLLKK
jgi:hypothetical protein